MEAKKLATDQIAEVAAQGVERALHARELNAAEIEEIGGGAIVLSKDLIYGGNRILAKSVVSSTVTPVTTLPGEMIGGAAGVRGF
jgi:hypothetical protein